MSIHLASFRNNQANANCLLGLEILYRHYCLSDLMGIKMRRNYRQRFFSGRLNSSLPATFAPVPRPLFGGSYTVHIGGRGGVRGLNSSHLVPIYSRFPPLLGDSRFSLHSFDSLFPPLVGNWESCFPSTGSRPHCLVHYRAKNTGKHFCVYCACARRQYDINLVPRVLASFTAQASGQGERRHWVRSWHVIDGITGSLLARRLTIEPPNPEGKL